jgi:DNA polymerase-3 subunit gamma/tau
MVLVRIAYVSDLPTPDEAIRMMEQGGNAGSLPAPRSSSASQPAPTARAMQSDAMAGTRSSPPRGGAEPSMRAQTEPAEAAPPQLRIDGFPALVALAGAKRDVMIKAALEADVRLVRIEDGRLELALEPAAQRTLIGELSRKLESWTGRRWTVIVSNAESAPTLREQAKAQKSQLEIDVREDERVKAVLARWPGAKIEVRRDAPDDGLDAESTVAPPDETDDD